MNQVFENNNKSTEDEMSEIEQKSFDTAVYISENHGNEIPEELLIQVAEKVGVPIDLLLKDYKYVSSINKIIDEYKNEKI